MIEPARFILSDETVTKPFEDLVVSMSAPALIVNSASFASSEIVMSPVASMSFAAVVLTTVRSPVVTVSVTAPASVSIPVTPQTVVTVNPFASTNVTPPVLVSMARFVTLVVASVNVTAPPATTARSLTMIPPPVPCSAETVKADCKQSVMIVGVSVRSMSLETVIAPLFASPMSRRLAVMWSSSASVRLNLPAVSLPRSICRVPVFCFSTTVWLLADRVPVSAMLSAVMVAPPAVVSTLAPALIVKTLFAPFNVTVMPVVAEMSFAAAVFATVRFPF